MWTVLSETVKSSKVDTGVELNEHRPPLCGKYLGAVSTYVRIMIAKWWGTSSVCFQCNIKGSHVLLLLIIRMHAGVPRDCEDLLRRGHKKNGVYRIQPDVYGGVFKVYCDMTTDGGGWTVIQRRKDGSENFYRPWNDYVDGFGDVREEFFLGLESTHQLAHNSNSELRVELEEWSGSKGYAKYNNFGVEDSATKYTLTVSGYSGNAGDSMSYHNGMKFSTYDQDNDVWNGNCAQTYKGAWWHKECHFSNLNGAYLGTPGNGGTIATFADGVIWYHLKNSYYYSVKGDVMMVRRK